MRVQKHVEQQKAWNVIDDMTRKKYCMNLQTIAKIELKCCPNLKTGGTAIWEISRQASMD